MGRFTRRAMHWDDAQYLPQLPYGTQNRGFCKFSTQLLSRLGCRKRAFRIKRLP
jgi:hypothetical protein